MKKIIRIVLSVLMTLSLYLPVKAIDTGYQYVNDEKGILSSSEIERLNKQYEAISNHYDMDVALVIVSNSQGQSMQSFADDYYDNHGFGRGSSKSGILLVHAIDSRKWHITTTGKAINIFTDAGIEYIGENLKTHFKEGNYYKAYDLFASMSDDFIQKGLSGRPYDVDNLPRKPLSIVYFAGGVIAALIIAAALVYNLKRQMISVTGKIEANDYMNASSLNITNSWDQFLYSRVTRTRRPKNNSSGGSSTHTSSSGTSHGGGGGSY